MRAERGDQRVHLPGQGEPGLPRSGRLALPTRDLQRHLQELALPRIVAQQPPGRGLEQGEVLDLRVDPVERGGGRPPGARLGIRAHEPRQLLRVEGRLGGGPEERAQQLGADVALVDPRQGGAHRLAGQVATLDRGLQEERTLDRARRR